MSGQPARLIQVRRPQLKIPRRGRLLRAGVGGTAAGMGETSGRDRRPYNSAPAKVTPRWKLRSESAGLDDARKSAETVNGPNRDQALSGIARIWGKTDLDGVVAWVRNFLDGTDRDEIIRLALIGQASINPQSSKPRFGTANSHP